MFSSAALFFCLTSEVETSVTFLLRDFCVVPISKIIVPYWINTQHSLSHILIHPYPNAHTTYLQEYPQPKSAHEKHKAVQLLIWKADGLWEG